MWVHTAGIPHPGGDERPRLQIGDIFRQFGPAYRQQNRVTDLQAKVMHAIEICRTPQLGGHRRVCLDCGHHVDEFNSCRDRHCPTCQALTQAKWIAKRQKRVLPVKHFHVVSTLPAQLRPIALANREKIYDLLFRTTADTLLELGADPTRYGIQLGITAVLHTWTRKLKFHPHIHCVVTAGGLAVKGVARWISITADFLFPVHVMSRLFRGKFMAGLDELYKTGQLILPLRDKSEKPELLFEKLKSELYAKEWVVYCKEPFSGVENVFRYLGRYTHRVAISNSRLISIDDEGVRFLTKGGNISVLTPFEFIRRFLLHVLPFRFVKIRHYGLMASGNVNTRLQTARDLITPINVETESNLSVLDALSWEELLLHLTGKNVLVCPTCASTNVRCYRINRLQHAPVDTS